MILEKHYPWKRLWCLKKGRYHMDDHGYLLAPESEYGRLIQPHVVSEDVFDKMPCLALLGEPGIGKTEAIKTLVSRRKDKANVQTDLLFLDLRAYGHEGRLYKDLFENPKFVNWINSTRTLEIFLDSLDECLIHVKALSPMLISEFKKYPVSRLRLRVACRTSEWPVLLSQELPQIWGGESYEEYELLPLSRFDVELAAREEHLDSDDFLRTLEERGMVPFAVKPMTLVMLLKQFKEAKGLGGDIVELYERYCRFLCSEPNVFRRDIGATGLIEPSLRLAVAERIAAITMFCKRVSVYKGQDRGNTVDEDVTLSDMEGGTESLNGVSIPVTEAVLRDVLGTGLFAGGEGERHVWSHWTYAEFLAARYIIRHQVSIEQIRDLIFTQQEFDEEGSRVIPQLKETAAWLATMHLPLLREIAKSDPQVLLRSSVSGTDASIRKEVTYSLLRKAEEETITDFDLRQRYKVLIHPGLPEQLRPYINDQKKGFLVRRMAIDIAEACEVRELVEDLLKVALDEHEDVHTRFQAADAVSEIGDTNAKVKLHPLLNVGDIDENDELKGCGLRALWPEHLTVQELFLNITKPKRGNFIGMYQLFLRQELMPHLKVSDLPTALAWVQRLPEEKPDEISALQDLSAEILQRAWENLHDAMVLDRFAKIAINRIEKYEPILGNRWRRGEHVELDDPNKRRRLVKAIMPKLEEKQIESVWQSLDMTGLITPEDFSWLIDQISTCQSEKDKELWAKLIRRTFDWIPQMVEMVWEPKESIPALEKEFEGVFSPIELDSERARRLRKTHEMVTRSQKGPMGEPLPPAFGEIVGKQLDKFESGNTEAWWILTLDMTRLLKNGKQYYGEEIQSDLTSTPGWNVIDVPTRERVIRIAYEYLLRGDPHTDDWFGKNIYHRPAAAGYKALKLLLNLAPERLSQLSSEAWAKWTPIILAYPESGGADTGQSMETLVAQAYSHAPDTTVKYLLALIDKDNMDHGHIFILRKMDKAWSADLEKVILEKVKDEQLKPAAAAELLEFLFERAKFIDEIREMSINFLERRVHGENPDRERAIYSGALLLMYGGETGWGIIQKLLDEEPEFGCDLIAHVARSQNHAGMIVRCLSERSVGNLYVWLAQKFPQSEDPYEEGVHGVGPREMIAHFRDALLNGLREKGTPESVVAIREIGKKLPDLTLIKFTAIEARQAAMRKTWIGSSPKEFLKLIGSNDNRLVDSEEQLLDVVVASLGRYQEVLLGEKPAVYDLWNTNDWTPKEEDLISDHVARHLESDLKNRGIVVNREVQIRKGQETDIHIVAIRKKHDGILDQVKVITEVKGCWHPEVKTAMETQLRDRYLRDNQCGHGIYLVMWFLCDKWKDESRKRRTPQWAFEEAEEFFSRQAKDLSKPGTVLRALLLDATLKT
jgi:hypothetical protein